MIELLLALLKQHGSQGVWVLNNAGVYVAYETPAEPRGLNLADHGRVLVVAFPESDAALVDGLTTLQPAPGYCRICGCSDSSACNDNGQPCRWVEADLCSACVKTAALDAASYATERAAAAGEVAG